jgi:uncharacterized membrane protein YhaH (DUF805 family)
MSNPYAAPDAVLSDVAEDETYEPQIFSVNGRIGRLRYLAYSWLMMMVVVMCLGILTAILIPMVAGKNKGTGMMVMGLMYIPIIAVSLIMAKRRFNDLDKSGWYSILILIPFVNFFVGLYLIFGPGTKGTNSYGPQPAKNSMWMALIVLVIPVIGILAAIAIPQYQNYVMRAKAAQQLQQQSQPQSQAQAQ